MDLDERARERAAALADAEREAGIARAQAALPQGESVDDSARECEECGDEIPEGRRQALFGVRLCVTCQARAEARAATQRRAR